MRKAMLFALCLACSGPVAPDAGMDAGSDAGAPTWAALGCTPTTTRPTFGEQRFCPSAHDYIGGIVGNELDGAGPWSFCGDGEITPDAGPDASCQAADHAWSLLQSCDAWVMCRLDEGPPCYHCAEWSGDPRFYP